MRKYEEIRREAERIVAAGRGLTFGSITVLDGWVTLDGDALDRDRVAYTLVVTDPPPGLAAWPLDDYLAAVTHFERASEHLDVATVYARCRSVSEHRALLARDAG